MDAVKGVAWAYKTIARYHPQLLVAEFIEEAGRQQRPHRALMLNKTLKILAPDLKRQVLEAIQ